MRARQSGDMTAGDKILRKLWQEGATLDSASAAIEKTPTSVAHKLVRLGLCLSRQEANEESKRRGGKLLARLETDDDYTIYLVRSPITNAPIYVGQSQNFDKRRKAHIKRFSLILGAVPIIEKIIGVGTYRHAREEERRQIAAYEAMGFTLLNIQDREGCQ